MPMILSSAKRYAAVMPEVAAQSRTSSQKRRRLQFAALSDMIDVFGRMGDHLRRVSLTGAMGAVCIGCLSTGCGHGDATVESDFDIPPSLVDRMRVSFNAVRNEMAGSETLDGDKMMAQIRLGYDDAPAIAERSAVK